MIRVSEPALRLDKATSRLFHGYFKATSRLLQKDVVQYFKHFFKTSFRIIQDNQTDHNLTRLLRPTGSVNSTSSKGPTLSSLSSGYTWLTWPITAT